MINELYALAQAMQNSGISGKAQHPSYRPLPNVTNKAPCIQILLSGSEVVKLRSLPRDTAAELRKYGNNQGSYPAMNLAPLYRVTAEEQIKQLTTLITGKTSEYDLEQLKNWCTSNNWSPKFLKKYKNCFQKAPEELQTLLQSDQDHPIHQLCRQSVCFQNAEVLHGALEACAFRMLKEKMDIPTAIQMLFYLGKADKDAGEDFGTLSVILDSTELLENGYSTVTAAFTQRLNDALLNADNTSKKSKASDTVDAFGQEFAAIEEPMPSVKLSGGFTVSLRTMFKEQYCQTRYDKIENASYPIAPELRIQLQSALEWISAEDRKNVTWTSLNKDEILFAYPESIPSLPVGLAAVLRRTPDSGQNSFESAAKRFLECLKNAKAPGTDSRADRIRIFILRKLDKARTKIVFTYNTTAPELEQRSEAWWKGCRALPRLSAPFHLDEHDDLFPLEATAVMNYAWKRNATLATDKFKPFASYHGMELFFQDGDLARYDLNVLIRNLEPVAMTLGGMTCQHGGGVPSDTIIKFRKSILLLGLLLERLGCRKEQYMQEFPYLYGQLLKVSDALHTLYCRVVRGEKQIPTQLVGGSLYNAAAEMPLQTLAQLGQRMTPYILWAKSYQYQKVSEQDKESWRAGWYLRLYEAIASQLAGQTGPASTFTAEQRAQLFVGYLAAFPKREKEDNILNDENTNGGTDHES